MENCANSLVKIVYTTQRYDFYFIFCPLCAKIISYQLIFFKYLSRPFGYKRYKYIEIQQNNYLTISTKEMVCKSNCSILIKNVL